MRTNYSERRSPRSAPSKGIRPTDVRIGSVVQIARATDLPRRWRLDRASQGEYYVDYESKSVIPIHILGQIYVVRRISPNGERLTLYPRDAEQGASGLVLHLDTVSRVLSY